MSFVSLSEAVDRLKIGEVVALPTETVYGLAGRMDSDFALKQIFSVKQRPFFDPLIVHVSERDQARALWTEWPEIYDRLTEKFWPGPLTLIGPRQPHVSGLITSGLETVAVRCPAHPMMREVIERVGAPLAAPSANRFGKVSPTLAQHVETEFDGQIPVLDGGPCSVGVESTVIAVEPSVLQKGWRIQILRPGGVSRSALRAALVDLSDCEIVREQSAASPGHLKAHYQPSSPLIILENQTWTPEIQNRAEAELGHEIGLVTELRLSAQPELATRELYEKMRQLVQPQKQQILFISRTPACDGESWEAIWDRLERAASLTLNSGKK